MANKTAARRDYGFIAIVTLVAANAVWLLLMPVVPAIASATLHRFHLRTESFVLWAIQQPIPSMYNFANRWEIRDLPPDFVMPGFLDPIIEKDESEKRYVNHFPSRILTFANRRYRHFHDGKDHWLIIESSYRGQTLETQIHAQPQDDGGYRMVFLDQP